MENEAHLIERAQAADMDAFCELAASYERRIYSLALHYCHNPQDAEDLSQEVWLRAYQSITKFRGDSSFYTWIRRITINCFLNRERSALARWWHTDKLAPEDTITADYQVLNIPGAETTLNNHILFAKVMRALAQLTPRQRLIFLLKHHEGMTYEEIANALGCSTGTAKKAVARALAKLRQQLQVETENNECVPCAAGQY
jgi:RNA polymerase sigma-70 factor (ECF subfamily)